MDTIVKLLYFFHIISKPTISVLPSQELQLNSEATPISSEKLNLLLDSITWDKSKIALLLHDNIVSISEKSFCVLFSDEYDTQKQEEIVNKFLYKIENPTLLSLNMISNRYYNYDYTIKFFKTHKDFVAKIDDFYPLEYIKKIPRKTIRNKFLEIFELSQEVIESRGNGIEVYGEFMPYTSFENGKKYEWNFPNVKVVLTKNENGNMYIEQTITKNGYSNVGSTISDNYVTIVNDNGINPE